MNNFQFYNLYKIIPSNDEKYIKRIVSEFLKNVQRDEREPFNRLPVLRACYLTYNVARAFIYIFHRSAYNSLNKTLYTFG